MCILCSFLTALLIHQPHTILSLHSYFNSLALFPHSMLFCQPHTLSSLHCCFVSLILFPSLHGCFVSHTFFFHSGWFLCPEHFPHTGSFVGCALFPHTGCFISAALSMIVSSVSHSFHARFVSWPLFPCSMIDRFIIQPLFPKHISFLMATIGSWCNILLKSIIRIVVNSYKL